MKLTPKEQAVHLKALSLASQHRTAEWNLIVILKEADETKYFKKLGVRSLFQYAVVKLRLSEPVALSLIAVMRKSLEIPELALAVKQEKLTVAKANRIVSCLNRENAESLIDFAVDHTWNEIAFETARINPKAAAGDKVKPLSEEYVQVTVTVRKKTYEKMKRADSLEAQRGRSGKMDETLETVYDFYLERQDPVRKAERAVKRKEKVCVRRVKRGRNLSAAEKHAVFARDQGKCTHQNKSGQRCGSDRWVEVHHIVPVSQGGSNDPENLTTLCSFHHDLVHQQSFGIDGQVSWLRSPSVEYGIN